MGLIIIFEDHLGLDNDVVQIDTSAITLPDCLFM